MAEPTSDSQIKEKCNNSTVWNPQSHLWMKKDYNAHLETYRFLARHFSSSIIQTIKRDDRRRDILFEQKRRRYVELMNERISLKDSKSLSSAPKKDAFDLKDLNESLPSTSASAASDDNETITWKPEQKQKIQDLMQYFMRTSPSKTVYLSAYVSALNRYIPLIADSENSTDDILKREMDTEFFTTAAFFKFRISRLARKAHFRTCKYCKLQELSIGMGEKNQEIQDSIARDIIAHGPAPSVEMGNNLQWNIEKFNNLSMQCPNDGEMALRYKQAQIAEMKNSDLEKHHQNVGFQCVSSLGNETRYYYKLDSEKQATCFPARKFSVRGNRRVSRGGQENMRSQSLAKWMNLVNASRNESRRQCFLCTREQGDKVIPD